MQRLHHLVRKKNIKFLIVSAFLLLSFILFIGVKVYSYFYVGTDNAYVNANVVQIAPRITGQVMTMHVVNNQYVKQGDALFDISPDSFQVAVAKAEAQLAINQAALLNAQKTAVRMGTLAQEKYVSMQENDNVGTALKTANASVNLAKAMLDQARLDLGWTHVTAPTSGWVTNVSLRAGDMIIANQPLFALISDGQFWVDANFKETELENIKAGQHANVYVDMYPGHVFQGVVQSISGGTGSAFSLLPPQNATGNWVKVTQRVPVRVLILQNDTHFPLRIGSSASVRVSLRSKYEAVPR